VTVGSIVAGNNGDDVRGPVTTDGGHNLIGDESGMSGIADGVNGNIVGVDPLLDPDGLQDNGGPTMTIALLAGSPAIDAISVEDCVVDTDQRGLERPQGAGCDIGAFEVEQSPEQPTISDLRDDVSNMDFHRGIERSLLAQLGAAGSSVDRGNTSSACGQLGAFINSVEAQRGKHIDAEQADELIGAANQVRDDLGC
jgi:hypothetical protein